MSAEEIRHRSFPTAFRGYDQNEVRQFLERLAREVEEAQLREDELQRQLREARDRILNPKLDEETLTGALGAEAGRILHSAHEAAADIRRKAEEATARILHQAHEEAAGIRGASDAVLAERTTEAEAAAEAIRAAATIEVATATTSAQEQAEALLAEAQAHSDALTGEAEAARDRVLGELTRRRRVLHAQVEQLGAGRQAVLDAVEDVRRMIDDITGSLDRVGAEAKAAADEALRRGLAEPLPIEEVEESVRTVTSPAPAAPAPPVPAPTVFPAQPSEVAEGGAPDDDSGDEESDVRVVGKRALRLVRPRPEPAPAPLPSAGPLPAPEVPAAGRPSVDELFARLRAERAAATEEAHAVLAEAGESVRLIPADAAEEPEAPEAPVVTPPAPAGADNGLRQRRDDLLAPVHERLARKLKRTLQDDQNDLLDRVRSRPPAGGSPVLPEEDDHRRRYATAVAPFLGESWGVGASLAAGGPPVGAAPGARRAKRNVAAVAPTT